MIVFHETFGKFADLKKIFVKKLNFPKSDVSKNFLFFAIIHRELLQLFDLVSKLVEVRRRREKVWNEDNFGSFKWTSRNLKCVYQFLLSFPVKEADFKMIWNLVCKTKNSTPPSIYCWSSRFSYHRSRVEVEFWEVRARESGLPPTVSPEIGRTAGTKSSRAGFRDSSAGARNAWFLKIQNLKIKKRFVKSSIFIYWTL